MAMTYLRKYGVSTTIDFGLLDVANGQLLVTAAHASGDTKIMKDEGAEANTTNGFTDEGQGYALVLTATEMEAARIVVYVVDQGTKLWFDEVLVIETYGHASAMHEFDFDLALHPANVTQWNSAAVATPTVAGVPEVDLTHWLGTAAATPTVAGVPEVDITHALGVAWVTPWVIRSGTTQSGGSLTTAILDSGASSTDEAYRDCLFLITTGANAGKTRQALSYTGASKTLTFFPDDPLNAAPNTVGFILLPSWMARIQHAHALPSVPLSGTQAHALKNASDMIVVSGYVWVDLRKVAGDATAVTNMLAAMLTELVGTAAGGGHSTTVMNTSIGATVADKFKGRRVYWTSGVLNRETAEIVSNTAGGQLTFAAVTAAPSDGDTFVIV